MSDERFQQIRLLEAMIFASADPLPEAGLAARLPDGTDVAGLLQELSGLYANRGVQLVHVGGKWGFRTAADLGIHLQIETKVNRRLSRAGIETLSVIAYHQPVTRAEIEDVRGVALSKGTLDTLLEIGWVRPKGRRRTPGRPVTWVTTDAFLDHFGLESLDALPGVEELRAAGLLDFRSPVASLGARMAADGAMGTDPEGEEEDAGEGEVNGPGRLGASELPDEDALAGNFADLPEDD